MSIEVASVQISTSLNLSGFNSGLSNLQRTKIQPLKIEAKLNTQNLERDRKQLEATLAKPLTLTLEVDDTALMTLRRRLQRQSPYKVKVTPEVDVRGVVKAQHQINKALGNIPTVKICVDDSELYDLNKHIELKRSHVKDVNQWMSANPIKIHTDTSKVDAFEKRNIKGKRVTVNIEYNDPGYKPSAANRNSATSATSPNKVAFDFTKPLEAQTKALDSCIDSAADKIADAIEKGFKSQKKGFLGEIGHGILMGATFSGGQALYDKAKGKVGKTVTQQKEQRSAYKELSYKSQVATSKESVRLKQQATVLKKEIQQAKEAEKLRQEMLQMNNRDVIQPLAKKLGVKAKTKSQAVEGLLKSQSPQQLKSNLPYIDTIREDAAKTSQQLSALSSQQLKSQLSETTKRLRTTFKGLKGSGQTGQLIDLGNEIEKEYQNVIALLSQATEEDVKAVLQSTKLQIGKLRKGTLVEQQKNIQASLQSEQQSAQQVNQQYLRRAKQPKFNPIQKRRIENFKLNADLVTKRAEQIYEQLGDLPADTERIAIVSGGFAGKLGKSSKGVAERMKPFLGDKTYVQHVNNPDTDDDVDYDQPGLGKVKWFKHVGKILARHNIGRGYSEDAIEAAAQAQALHRKAKEQGLKIPHIEGYGYSSGGYVMQGAAELSRENRIPFKGVGLGTPHYGVSNTAKPEEYMSILGDQDLLWMLQGNKFDSPNLKTYKNAGEAHILEKYTKNADVQRDVYKFMGREAPFVLGNQFEEDMMKTMSNAQSLMQLNPKLRPALKASGEASKTLDSVAEHRRIISDQINNVPAEILEDVQAADEVLQALEQQIIRGFKFNDKKSAPLAKQTKTQKTTPAQQITGNTDKEKQILTNYHAILKEMADISGVTVNQAQVPKLTVDQDKLTRLGANAYYESGSKNEITIKPELAELLALPTEELTKYGKELNPITHELFHSIDLGFGKKTIGGLARGTDKIETPLSPSVTKNGERMAKIAMADVKRSQPRANDSYIRAIGQLEQRAYNFQGSTDKILERVAANPQQVDQIRTASQRAEQLGKDLKKVIKPPNLEPIINNGLQAYKGLTARQAKQLEQNYKNFFKEIATLSDFDLSGRNLPGLTVDEHLLEQQAADALYDIENNQIIISKQLQKALAETPKGLQQYADLMEALVHEARHAMQFDLGDLTMQDLQLGLKPGTNLKEFAATSSKAQKAALESVDYAMQQNPGMTDRARAVLGTVEADASDFEQHTQGIIDNLIATDTFENAFGDFKQEKAAFRQALDDIEKYLSEGLTHITKVITDFGKGLATKAQNLISGFLTGNQTRKNSGNNYGGFQYVRRGRGQASRRVSEPEGIPDPWEDSEYRRADVVSGTTPQLPRADQRGIGQRIRVRVRKPLANTVNSAQQQISQRLEEFNNRLENYVNENIQETLREVASLSGNTLDPNNLPKIQVDNASTSKAGKDALYDVKKNQIIISSRMRDLLRTNPEALEKYSKELKPLVVAARKAVDVNAPEQQVEEFAKQSGAVYARISTRAKGKRSNMPAIVREASEGIDGAIDALAKGAKETVTLKRRAQLYFQTLKRAARTPDNVGKTVNSVGSSGGIEALMGGDIKGFMSKSPFSTNNSMQSMRVALGRRRNQPFGSNPEPGTATWERIGNKIISYPMRQRGAEFRQKAQQKIEAVYAANPKLPKNLSQLTDQISKKFKIPIDLYARLNVKGLADTISQAQKIVGKELDKLQEKAAALPYLGDMASKAVGGLKLLNVAGVGAGVTFLRFLGVITKFTALQALATQVQLVVLQFDALKKSFVATANEGNRSAEAFDRVMASAGELGVDKATAAQGATEIFGNVTPKMGTRMAESLNRAAQESALIYSSSPQQSQQIFSAFGQLAQESTLTMGNFQQLMNAMPGSLDTAARSMGMTNAEFQNFIQNNTVLVEDFLPRFIQQLNVDNQPRLAGAMDTLTTATNKYNNAIVDMQLEVGKTLSSVEKLRVQTTAFLAETVGKWGAGVFAKWGLSMAFLSAVKAAIQFKNVVAALLPIFLKLPFAQVAIAAIGLAIKHVLPLIIKMSAEFLLFQLAIDAISAVFKSFSNAGGQFTTWAENSATNIQKMTDAFDKASKSASEFKNSLPTDEKDLKATSSRFEDTLVGSIFGKKNVRWAEGKMDKALSNIPGYKTFAQKELYDKEEAVQKLRGSGGEAVQKVLDLRMGKDKSLSEMTALDKQLDTIRMKRRAISATNPADVTGLRQLREQERSLMARKDVVATPVAATQSAIAAQIKTYEDALAKIDEESRQGAWTQEAYDRATQGLKSSLLEAENAQKYLNSQIKDSATALQALQRNFQSLNAQLADNATTLQKQYNATLKGIYSDNDLSSAQKQFAQQAADQDLLAAKLRKNREIALEMRESLAAQGGEEILTNWKVDLGTTDTQGFQLLAQRAEQQGNAKEQEVFTQYARIKELELETSDMEAQVVQRQSELQQQLRDLTKQVEEYYRGIARQAAESEIQIAKQMSELDNQQLANKVNAAMLGVGDNIISQFVGSILEAINQIAQAADTDLDAQSQILQAQNAFEDTVRSGEELRKQLPKLQASGTIPSIPVELDLSTVANNKDVKALNSEIDKGVSATEDLSKATENFNSTVSTSGDLISDNTSATQTLEGSVSSVSSAMDLTVTSTENLNTTVSSTTDSAQFLQNQIDTNTTAVDGTNTAMQAVGTSLDANTQKTIANIEQTSIWHQWLGEKGIGGAIANVLDGITKIGAGIMDGIAKTVDWFKTFANNIPILNQVGQTIAGFSQQIAQTPVGQAVGGAIQGAGNLINQGVGAIQGALGLTTDGKGKVTENYRTGTLAAQEYGAARPGRKHAGQDIDVSGNQQAQSFIGGVVTRVVIDTNGKGYGSYVDIFNKQLGVVERIAEVLKVNVKEGQTVQPGQAIGGGESRTGVFHYEIRKPADAQGRGGYGFEGSQDPIKFYEKLGIAKREGNQIKILKGLNAGQTLNAAEHRVGDGHNHFGEDDVKKANQKAAAGANSGTVGVGNNLLASMPQGNGQTPGQIVADLKAKAAIAQGVAPQQASRASGRFTMPLPTGGNLNSGAGQNVPSWIPKMSWQQHKQFIVTQAMQAGITDPNQIKYMLATAEHETGKGMYMREGGNEKYLNYLSGRRDLGNNGIRDAVSYRGAGYSQLTGKSNFAKWSPIVSKHFGVNIDLLKNPDLAAHPDIAAFILTQGMKTGDITGRAIGKYIDTGAGKVDFRNARRTINGIVPEQVAKIDKVLAGISLNEVQQMMAVAQKGGGGVPMQAVAQATGGQTGVNIQAPQAFVPSAPMTVWEPASLKGATPTATSAASVAASGNARIDQTQALAQQQRDRQQAAALRQAAAKTEGDTIQAINKSQQSLIQVQKQLRQAGFESRDIGEDITKMNLEAMGPLTLPQQREKAIQEQRRQYRDQGEKVNELIIDRENRKKAAQAILDLPGGIISPAARAKFDKILAMPISEDLKKRLQTELTSGSLGEELKKTLQQSVTQADQELVVLRKAQQDLNTGREVALKATEERFELEEKARANAAKFEQKGLDIATLQARLDNAKARADREGVTSSAAKEVVNLEALIGLQNQQLENEKQLEEIDKKVRDKTLTEAEANTQKNAIKQRSEITQKTIQENQAYQEIVNARAVDARNREISLQAAKDELAVQKQQLETLKALPTTDPRRLEIPQLEYGIQLQELQLKLQEDIAAVQESVFKDPSSQAAGDVRIAKLKEEYELNAKNLGTRLKQQNVEQELAQQRAIIGIREQELGFTEQLLEAQTRSIELGRSSGDTLGDRYKLQADQQKLSFEKQILDVKELALQSGKSAEEVAAIEAQLRKVNEIRLDNIQGEMDKAFKDRAIAVQQRTFDSTNSVLSAQQSLLSTTGQSFEASKIGKKIAINQQQMDFTNQTRELEEFIKTNAVASEQANVLRSNLAAVNDIKFQEIQAQFNPLKGVVDGVAGSLKGAFKSLIKDGKVDIKSFFDGILDSIADFLSNMLVEKLMGFLNPTKKKQAPGLLPDPSAQGQQQQPDYLSALGLGKNPLQPGTAKKPTADYLSALGLGENPLTAADGALSKLGSSQVTPMYVSVVNANQLGFAQGQNNIVPFNTPGMGGNLGAFGSMSSILGGKTDYISAVMGGGGFDPFSAFTATSPLPVNVAQAKPDLFSSLLGGSAGGGGGLGGILGSLGGMLGGGGGMGGGFGGIIGSLLPMVGSLFGGIFAEGGVIGTGKSAKDDQLILAQRGEGILTHNGMRVIGGAAALNAINRTKGYKVPKFATGGIVGGEYGGKNSADAVQRGHEERERRRNEPIKLETQVINNVEYATITQVEQAASKARAEGARQGAQYVQNKMENSVSWRNRHGIR